MPDTSKRSASLRSIQSAWSLRRAQLFEQFGGKGSALIECAKLTSLTLLPLAVVFGLCIKSLLTVNRDIRDANSIYRSVERSQDIGVFVSSLLNERGLRCQYLAVDDGETLRNLLPDLVEADNRTNELANSLKEKLPSSFFNFSTELDRFRNLTWSHTAGISCSNVSSWYSFYTHKLEEECSEPFSAAAVNSFWSAYFAYNAYLIAQDMIGLQRAIGTYYYGDGALSLPNYIYFSRNAGAVDAFLDQVVPALHKPAYNLYQSLTGANAELMTEIKEQQGYIFSHALKRSDRISIKADRYFNSMTTYMNTVSAVEDFLRASMAHNAMEEKRARQEEYQAILILVILVVIISPASTTWYTYHSRRLMRKIAAYADCLKQQTTQLNLERKKAELLLCQMLPKTIVSEMAQNKPVEPEAFDEATIFFSRVHEFQAFVLRSDPFQVVDLLNHLYVKCDNILDQYDAYKVETIGDSYMIVSGVPRRNGHKHSAEIATIALHFLMMMQDFQVSTLPNERVALTLGVHTGQVVAGVMGVKQQRYCLFGDAVNTASRMMSTGVASRIHLSSSTTDHLHMNHKDQFSTQLRGPASIKGKGIMITHWLVGRKGFPFTAAL